VPLLLLVAVEALRVPRALGRAGGTSGAMLSWLCQVCCRDISFTSERLVMVELSSSKAPSPILFPMQPECDLGDKDRGQGGVSQSSCYIH